MDKQKLVELKLCPFCGWEAKLIKGTDYSGEVEKPIWMAVCTNSDCRSQGEQTKELMGCIADHHDNLLSILFDKQNEIFEKFDDCWDELTDINEREIFVYAFKLGMRIAIEVLSSNTD